MRIVVAPDKFKGCLSAPEVAAAMAEGVRQVVPGAEVVVCPMADGGEGTVGALVAATGGEMRSTGVTGPVPGRRVEAAWGMLGGGGERVAVMEMAAAAGLALLKEGERDPMRTTTFGVGEMIRAAVNEGVRKIILGIGGSATTDGGVGCAQGCGARVWIETDPGSRSGFNIEEALPMELRGAFVGGDLGVFHSMTRPVGVEGVQIVVACDVTNPLYGAEGAARVFGPQKGATAAAVEELDRGLERLAVRTRNVAKAHVPGAGAAGGLGFGMLAFFGAELRSGVGIVIEAVGLREKLRGADLCITGEGRLDRSSLGGKVPVGVGRVCREVGVPCVAVAGQVGIEGEEVRGEGIGGVYEIGGVGVAIEERMARARELIAEAAGRVVREVLGRG